MAMKNISIGPARSEEIEDIYDILAAEGYPWSPEQVEKNLFDFTVLRCEKQLVAVLFGAVSTNNSTIFTAVHPGYPDHLIASSLCNLLTGISAHRIPSGGKHPV